MYPSNRGSRERGLSRRRQDPIGRLRSEMGRMFDRWFREPFEELTEELELGPEMDIVEEGDEIVVRAEIPGVDPKSIDLSILGRELSVSGEKKEEKTEEHGTVYRSERWYGSFCRTIQLPESADTDRCTADYSDGILTIRFPKLEGTRRVTVSGGGAGRKLSDVMTRDVECVKPDDTVKSVADRMKSLDIGSFPVCDSDGKVVGMITDRDLTLRVLAEGKDPASTPVRAVMSKNVISCRPDESVEEAEAKMKQHRIRRIPVVDEKGKLAGYFSIGKIAKVTSAGEQSEVLKKVTQPSGS